MKSMKRRGAVKLYTVIACCCFAAFAILFYACGKTFIYKTDGYYQHYMVLSYIRKTFLELLHGEKLHAFDFTLGQGMDVLTTLTFYGWTDPLNWIAAFIPQRFMEYGYALIVFLRIYLAGLAAMLYFRRIGVRDAHALAWSSVIYAFCGFSLVNMGRHPYFVNGMLYLPLLLTSIENLLTDRKWKLFTLTAALQLVVNFYFAYFNTVIAIIYIIVRLIVRAKERGWSGTARDGFALMGAYLLGAALSAVVLLPVALQYLNNSRLNESAGIGGSLLIYDRHYYFQSLATAFTGGYSLPNWTALHLSPLALFATTQTLTLRDSRAKQLRAALILCILGLCLPAFGKLMNGFAYISNRWSYTFALFIAAASAVAFVQKAEHRKPLLFVAGGYILYLIAYGIRSHTALYLCSMPMILIALVCFRCNHRLRRTFISCALVMGILVYTGLAYLPMFENNIESECDAGVYEAFESSTVAETFADSGLYRTEQPLGFGNTATVKGFLGNTYYWSLIDSGVSNYYRELYTPALHYTYQLLGLQGSGTLNALSSVKYFVRNEGSSAVIPAGYSKQTEINGFEIYENPQPLTLGYAFDATMDTTEYQALPVEQKYQALTQFAVCDEPIAASAAFEDRSKDIPFEIIQEDDAMHLTFDAPANHELYLILEKPTASEDCTVMLSSDYGEAALGLVPKQSNFYFERAGSAVCLGSGAEGLHECSMTASTDWDQIEVESMRLVALPLETQNAAIEARHEECLQDTVLSADRLSGSITVGGERILQISVPYSKGWSATVDGESAELFRCGSMYMGLKLEGGSHTVELEYRTPGMRVGAIVSAFALCLFILLSVIGRRKVKP